MEQQNILFHSLTEEWKSTELGPEFFDTGRPVPPEQPPPPQPEDGSQDVSTQQRPKDVPLQRRPQDTSQHQMPQSIPLQYIPQDTSQRPQSMSLQRKSQDVLPQPQRPQSMPLQFNHQDALPQQRFQDRPHKQTFQSMPQQYRDKDMLQERTQGISAEQQMLQDGTLQQRPHSTSPQQKLQDMPDNMKRNATESTSRTSWPKDTFYALRHSDRITGFKSPNYKTQTFLDEIITIPKNENDDLQALVVHLRNQLAQKDREIDTLRRNADLQKPELSCLKEKYSNLQQSFITVKSQLDTAGAMCLSLEKNISDQAKEQEVLKDQCEEQSQTIKKLQAKLQKRASDVASLENSLNIEQTRQRTSVEETAEKFSAREEMAKRFKEDLEKQEKLLELERSKNLETINRMQLTKSMFEEQKKSLEEENSQLRQVCDQLNVNAQEMENTVKLQQQQLAKKNDDLLGMEKEMRKIRMRNEEITCNYQKMVASLKTELALKNNQYDEMEARLKELESQFRDLQEELSAAVAKVQKLTEENTLLQNRLKKANGELQKENLEKQANQEKLIDARQVMASLKNKVNDLNSSHSKEINLLKQTISDLENIIARKDDIITEQQSEISNIKSYIRTMEGEMANVLEQARLEREKHKTLYEKAGLLSEFLDKSSETLTEKQEEVWALKHQLEKNRKLSPIMEESEMAQSTFGEKNTSATASRSKDKFMSGISHENITDESSSYSMEDLKEDLKYKEQCMQELTNVILQMGLEGKQKEAELQQEILKLKSVISMKESILSLREKQLAKAEYELSINNAILKEANITVHQKEIELEKEKQKSKQAAADTTNKESLKNKVDAQEPLWLTSIEKSENTDEVCSIDSQGSCLIYETEIGSLKEITNRGMRTKKEHHLITSTPIHKIHAEIAKQTDHAAKIINDLKELHENVSQPLDLEDIDSDKSEQHSQQRSYEIKNQSIKIKTKNTSV